MSIIEAGLTIVEDEQSMWHRLALEVYIGEQLAPGHTPEPFIRQAIETRSQKDVSVLWSHHMIGYCTVTENGIARREYTVADDDLSLRRFTNETGIDWTDAVTWTLDAQTK